MSRRSRNFPSPEQKSPESFLRRNRNKDFWALFHAVDAFVTYSWEMWGVFAPSLPLPSFSHSVYSFDHNKQIKQMIQLYSFKY